ncbi:MAG TPA: addiction module protein [bacterium]|nr:addiction module protein [bacterium]
MKKISMADMLDLPVEDRITLVQDLWDSIAEVPEKVALTAEQREELDRRLDAFHRDPEAGSPWEEVKARILGSLKVS